MGHGVPPASPAQFFQDQVMGNGCADHGPELLKSGGPWKPSGYAMAALWSTKRNTNHWSGFRDFLKINLSVDE
jgi:hypothetical protein